MKFHLLLLLLPLMRVAHCAAVAHERCLPSARKQRLEGSLTSKTYAEAENSSWPPFPAPETYYDYRGAGMGLQYALADHFAHSEGLKVRMELAKETTELLDMVKRGGLTRCVLPIDDRRLPMPVCRPPGSTMPSSTRAGRCAAHADELAEAPRLVWPHHLGRSPSRREETLRQVHEVRRHMQAVFLSRDRGIGLAFHDLFISSRPTWLD